MATNVKVLSTDLKQATIKVNPGTYLTDVLEQACKRFGLSPDKFLLKHKQKQLDLSHTFRTSGLAPGAKLELVARSKSPSVITVAVDLPETEARLAGNRRLTEKVPSDYTLWRILRHVESVTCQGTGVNLTGRGVPQLSNGADKGSGQLYYETPVLLIMNRSFSTFVDFQRTLSQLGYNSGNVLIRLSFQRTDKTLADAMSDIGQYFKEEDQPAKEVAAKSEPASTPAPAEPDTAVSQLDSTSSEAATRTPASTEDERPVETHQEAEAMETDSAPADPLAPISVFSAPSASTPAAAQIIESEEVFNPSVAHAQLHQERLHKEGQNKRLLSDKELADRAAAEDARLSAIKSVEIKVRFPDNTSAQWNMGHDGAGEMLYAAVRQVMAASEAPFRLVLPGHTGVIRDEGSKLIKTYGLSGRTLVNLVWDDAVPSDIRQQPFLKQSVASRAKEVEVPQVPEEAEEAEPQPGPSMSKSAQQQPRNEGSGVKKAMPKWLKLPGKK